MTMKAGKNMLPVTPHHIRWALLIVLMLGVIFPMIVEQEDLYRTDDIDFDDGDGFKAVRVDSLSLVTELTEAPSHTIVHLTDEFIRLPQVNSDLLIPRAPPASA